MVSLSTAGTVHDDDLVTDDGVGGLMTADDVGGLRMTQGVR